MARPRAVIDASCIVRGVVDDSEQALDWLEAIEARSTEAFAPDLVFAEVAHTLLRQARAGLFPLAELEPTMHTVAAYPIVTTPSRLLAESAVAVALERGLTAYDGHYVVLAEAEDAVLVTADRRLAEAASRSILLD